MRKNKKLLTALVLALIFSFSLMPMAFAAEDAAPAEAAAAEPVIEAAPVAEVAAPEAAEPVVEASTPEAAEKSEATETAAAEVTETSEMVETVEVTDAPEANEESEATETNPAAEAAETTGASLYTVEFVNPKDGSEVKIVGGSDVYLTALNQELGLGVDIEEVASVESSNDELFTAEKIDGDYVIHTYQPFTSAEQLLINLINSGVVSVDVFDADYSTDEGFKAIADSFKRSVTDGDNTWYVPTKDSVIKIQYLGKTWDVIGFNGTGIGAKADQMMLLLDGVDGTTQFNSSRDKGNNYSGSKLQSAMQTYLDTITSGQDADMVALLAEMTLNTDSYRSSNPYCDGVKGDSVTSKIRPLTTQEAMILTNFNKNCSDAVTGLDQVWWLASPSCCTYQDRDKDGTLSAEVVYKTSQVGNFKDCWNCFYVDAYYGLRPALLLSLTDDIITSEISEGVYELKFKEPEPDPDPPTSDDAVPVYVHALVYLDGKLLNEGTDYNWVNGKIVLTDDFVKTLSAGTHKIAVLYSNTYGDTLPADFEYTAANSYDFTVGSEG